MKSELIQKAGAIMKASKAAVIALTDENGFPRASTISNLKTEGIKHAWFATGLSSGKAKCLRLSKMCQGDGSVDTKITL